MIIIEERISNRSLCILDILSNFFYMLEILDLGKERVVFGFFFLFDEGSLFLCFYEVER